MDFESLIDLVNFYMKHPLYRKVKLTHPIPKDMLKRINTMNVSDSFVFCSSLQHKEHSFQGPEDNGAYSYMDPSCINEKVISA